MRTRSRNTRAARRDAPVAALWVVALLGTLAASVAFAGQPMTMTDDATGTSRAAADTARRTVKKAAPSTSATAAPAKSSPLPGRPAKAVTAAPTATKTGPAKASPPPAAAASRVAAGAKGAPKAATTSAGQPASVASRTRTPGVAAKSSPASRPAQATAPMVAKVAPAAATKSGVAATDPTAARTRRTPTTVTQSVATPPAQRRTPGRSASVATRTATTTHGAGAGAKALGVGAAGAAVSVVKVPRQPTATGAVPTPGSSKSKVQAPVAALEDHVTYQYNALGRRDPFQSLMEGEYVGAAVGGAAPDLGGLKVVGIVWGSLDQFAMAEDVRGNSYVLRRGDRVMNGFVEGLKRDAMIVNITVDGQSQSVSIPVTRKGERTNASR